MKRLVIALSVFLSGCISGVVFIDKQGYYQIAGSFPMYPTYTDNFGKAGVSVGVGGGYMNMYGDWPFTYSYQYDGYAVVNTYRKFGDSRVGWGFSGYFRASRNVRVLATRVEDPYYFPYRYDTVEVLFPSLTFNTYVDINSKYVRFVPFNVSVSVLSYPTILEDSWIVYERYPWDICPGLFKSCYLLKLDATIAGISIRPIPYLSISGDLRTAWFAYLIRVGWEEYVDASRSIPLMTLNVNFKDLTGTLGVMYIRSREWRNIAFIDASISYRIRPWRRKKVKVEEIE